MGSRILTTKLEEPKRTIEFSSCLDLYTRYIPLHQKASFWGTFVSSLKGGADLCAGPEPRIIAWYPSITETLPPSYPDLRHEFGKLETLQWRQRRGTTPPTPVEPEANDRIHTIGYNYCPVHTEIYGSYRNRAARGVY